MYFEEAKAVGWLKCQLGANILRTNGETSSTRARSRVDPKVWFPSLEKCPGLVAGVDSKRKDGIILS